MQTHVWESLQSRSLPGATPSLPRSGNPFQRLQRSPLTRLRGSIAGVARGGLRRAGAPPGRPAPRGPNGAAPPPIGRPPPRKENAFPSLYGASSRAQETEVSQWGRQACHGMGLASLSFCNFIGGVL